MAQYQAHEAFRYSGPITSRLIELQWVKMGVVHHPYRPHFEMSGYRTRQGLVSVHSHQLYTYLETSAALDRMVHQSEAVRSPIRLAEYTTTCHPDDELLLRMKDDPRTCMNGDTEAEKERYEWGTIHAYRSGIAVSMRG